MFFDTRLARLKWTQKSRELKEKEEALIEKEAKTIEKESAEHWVVGSLPIEMENKQFFSTFSLRFPKNLFVCEADNDQFKYFTNMEQRVTCYIGLTDEMSRDDFELLKQNYQRKMTSSKQKTVWLDDEIVKLREDILYFTAKHPMPENDLYNLTAFCGSARFVCVIQNEKAELWLDLFKNIIETYVK